MRFLIVGLLLLEGCSRSLTQPVMSRLETYTYQVIYVGEGSSLQVTYPFVWSEGVGLQSVMLFGSTVPQTWTAGPIADVPAYDGALHVVGNAGPDGAVTLSIKDGNNAVSVPTNHSQWAAYGGGGSFSLTVVPLLDIPGE